MTTSTADMTVQSERLDTRRDSSLGFFPYLPKATFEIARPFHPRHQEPRRSSIISFHQDGDTATGDDQLFARFLETCIELEVHKAIADVMMDRIEDDIESLMEAHQGICDELEEVRDELEEAREREAAMACLSRRKTVGVELSPASGMQGGPTELTRRNTTDRVALQRKPLPRAMTSCSFPAKRESMQGERLEEPLFSELELRTYKRVLNQEKSDLGVQIASLCYQAQGSGVVKRSFEKVQAKVKQRQKELWLEMAEEISGEGLVDVDGKGKGKIWKWMFWS